MDSEAEQSGATDRTRPRNRRLRVVPYGPPRGTPCALCARPLQGADDLVVQYHRRGDEADDDSEPVPGADCRGVCPDCAEDVAELLASWTATARPPIHGERSIAAGYRAIADECSFCDRTVDGGHLVGVECYRAGTDYEDGLGPHRHHVLCPHCVGVFERFLADVSADVSDRASDGERAADGERGTNDERAVDGERTPNEDRVPDEDRAPVGGE